MIRATGLSLTLTALAAITTPAEAEGLRFRTELGLSTSSADATSLEADLGYQNTQAAGAGLRLMWDGSSGPFRFEFHAGLTAAHGSQAALSSLLADPSVVSPPTSAFAASVERASVTFTTDTLVLKFGRQAITWGGGLFFHPSDIVAPFSPDAIDTTYKPGVDMVYAQYLFDNGADIQAIAVPRIAVPGGPPALDASTFAIRASLSAGAIDGTLTFGRDRGDTVAGLGISGPLGEASWNAEYVHWKLASGAQYPSWLFNVSNFGTLGDWNVSYFAEYYHNGFGMGAATPLDALSTALSDKMATGQVFLAGRDFLGLGGQAQVTADLSLAPSAIFSLDDGSVLAGIGINYTLGDNTDLSFNYFHPFGADGSEFGGRETSSGSGVFAGPSRSATLRLVHFF